MKIALMIVVLALAGCAEIQAVKTTVAVHGAQIEDSKRETAEWTLCKAISVGAWVRAYGDNATKAQAWRTLCAQAATQTPK